MWLNARLFQCCPCVVFHNTLWFLAITVLFFHCVALPIGVLLTGKCSSLPPRLEGAREYTGNLSRSYIFYSLYPLTCTVVVCWAGEFEVFRASGLLPIGSCTQFAGFFLVMIEYALASKHWSQVWHAFNVAHFLHFFWQNEWFTVWFLRVQAGFRARSCWVYSNLLRRIHLFPSRLLQTGYSTKPNSAWDFSGSNRRRRRKWNPPPPHHPRTVLCTWIA